MVYVQYARLRDLVGGLLISGQLPEIRAGGENARVVKMRVKSSLCPRAGRIIHGTAKIT